MKKQIVLCCIAVFAVGNLFAQFKRTKTPLKLAEGIISTNDVFMGAITPDNKEIYFVKSRKTRKDLKIMFSKFEKGKWSEPMPVPFATGGNDIDPFVTPDGKRLIFNSNKSVTDGSVQKDFNIWAVDRKDNGWGEPYIIEELKTDSTEFYATSARNGNLYFASIRPEGKGNVDIYFSKLENGRYTKPVALNETINSPYSDSNPFIAPDESYLIFLSSRPGGFGASDLYISFNNNGTWSTPENLGPTINTEVSEFCPVVSGDGKTFLFSRTHRNASGDILNENIFYISTAETIIGQKRNSKLRR